MSVALYMDEHVPSAFSNGLHLRGIDVLTVQQDGMLNRPDSELVDRATMLNRVIFTQDRDFLIEAADRQSLGVPFSGFVYCAQLAASLGKLVADLELIGKAMDPIDMADRVEYLPF